jgi:hypothetical protein
MEKICHNQLIFQSLFSKEVIADFAGGLLLRELDQRYRLVEKAAQCLHDPRDTYEVKYDLLNPGTATPVHHCPGLRLFPMVRR